MAELTMRPDIDIEEDLHDVVRAYPPLNHDRRNYKFDVKDGVVTLTGHVKGKPTYEYVLNAVPLVSGVRSFEAARFYNDDDLRLDVGQVVPPGVLVTMEYGSAILSGHLPEDASIEDVVRAVARVPGVHRVLTSLR
ncbi:MAG: hypothetical protein OHK0046_36160 [Anaerolineae bacterium]